MGEQNTLLVAVHARQCCCLLRLAPRLLPFLPLLPHQLRISCHTTPAGPSRVAHPPTAHPLTPLLHSVLPCSLAPHPSPKSRCPWSHKHSKPQQPAPTTRARTHNMPRRRAPCPSGHTTNAPPPPSCAHELGCTARNSRPWPAPCASLKMFLMRSMILSAPEGVISPTSPVWKKPSSSAWGEGGGRGGCGCAGVW